MADTIGPYAPAHRGWVDDDYVEGMLIHHPFPVFDHEDWSQARIDLETKWLLCAHPEVVTSTESFIRNLAMCRECRMPVPLALPTDRVCTHVSVWLEHRLDGGIVIELVTHPVNAIMHRPEPRLI